MKILVVEDFDGFRHLVATKLADRTGAQIVEALDGVEAIEQAEAWRPELILLDIGLPKLDGLGAAERLRKVVPASKLMFLTQDAAPEVVRRALELGALGYVMKTRAHSDLLPAVAAVLAGKLYLSPGLEFSTPPTGQLRHEVQFYSRDDVLARNVSRFIGAALENQSAAIVVATDDHRDAIREKLDDDGIDVDEQIQRGTYIPLDAEKMLGAVMAGGEPNLDLFADGLRRLIARAANAAPAVDPCVAICGECVGLLHAEGKTEHALCLEQVGNDLVASNNIQILCAYPVAPDGEDAHTFEHICSVHAAAHYR